MTMQQQQQKFVIRNNNKRDRERKTRRECRMVEESLTMTVTEVVVLKYRLFCENEHCF